MKLWSNVAKRSVRVTFIDIFTKLEYYYKDLWNINCSIARLMRIKILPAIVIICYVIFVSVITKVNNYIFSWFKVVKSIQINDFLGNIYIFSVMSLAANTGIQIYDYSFTLSIFFGKCIFCALSSLVVFLCGFKYKPFPL